MANWQKILDDCYRLWSDERAPLGEREAAFAKMTTIMDKYKLEVSKEMNTEVNIITHKRIEIEGTWQHRKIEMGFSLRKLFDVRIVSHHKGGWKYGMTIIGTEFSVVAFEAIFRVICSQFEYGLKVSGARGRSGRASYALGYALGLDVNVKAVWAERNKNTEVQALVLVSDAQNQAYQNDLFGEIGNWKSSMSYSDLQAVRAGYQDGVKATVDRTLE